ncbi:hypothetical protein [Mesorhizobium amorphae]|uniref:hypothetical protein n=1 Tax=Mesorhizobium amorphae TaxID=71433 RepID=UPI00177BCAEC|nr:hypothetical protein [Mesorhizobium amorphae]
MAALLSQDRGELEAGKKLEDRLEWQALMPDGLKLRSMRRGISVRAFLHHSGEDHLVPAIPPYEQA